MSEPFLAEIRMVGFNFAPRGWAFCDGQILPINQNQSLYSLLGTTYGGDGRTSFALPDLRSRVPMHLGNSEAGTTIQLGQRGGAETVTLSAAEMPGHTHSAKASAEAASVPSATNNFLGSPATSIGNTYRASGSSVSLNSNAVGSSGGGQGRQNMQPYQTLTFCIALQGLFPSRN
ncbi:MAG: tail fiber protein [Cyanobacteria bacterium P01_A01_bin.3]